MKPICVKCQCFYRPKKNGFYFVEGMPIGINVPIGKKAPDRWHPYKLWVGDLWQCPECSHQIISGVGSRPVSEHYEPEFDALVKRSATIQINDC